VPALARLAARWRELVALMQGAAFAHCNLQHASIMVDRHGELRLVGYDDVWIPPLAGLPRPAGPGHRNYQHPGRRDTWGRWFDTFSALVIYLSLVALTKNADLWQELYNTENLLFTSADFVAPFQTRVWQLLAGLHDSQVDRLARRLRECCAPDWVATGSLEETIEL
jgi:eukaryotic-like serine/threonine-protein kinase